MKPVFQTKFGDPDGNCLAACLASILEIGLDQIPDFGNDSAWYDRFSQWMVTNFDVKPIDLSISQLEKWEWNLNGYHLINGKSPRGDFYHSVVGLDGEMVHDPHPDGTGIRTPETFTLFVSAMRQEEGMPQGDILVESTVSHRTLEPLVTLRWGLMRGQLSPDEARAHALLILEAAEAAQSDAFLVHFLKTKIGVQEIEKIAMVLSDMRAYRGKGHYDSR
jgi:hypothetical protein